MRRLLLVVLLLWVSPLMAATIDWGAFAIAETGPDMITIGYVGHAVYANSSVQIQTTTSHDGMLTISEKDTYLASFTAWAVAFAGEIVNAAMLSDVSRLFYRNDGIQANNPFDVNYESDTFYFAFETLVWQDEDMSGVPQTEYGWVNISVAAGELSVVDSAMGLNGSPMIVGGGAIPEPTSGVLLVLGFAALALTRKVR